MTEQLTSLTEPLNGRYQIWEILGTGGMGKVYRADDLRAGGSVAIKVLSRGAAGDSHALTMFNREVTLLTRLRHPGIVQVLDSGVFQEQPFLVMEYVPGESLAAICYRSGLPPLLTAVNITIQVAAALGAAHQAGITHCDIKPANLLLTAPQTVGATQHPMIRSWSDWLQVKVVDFGIAHSATTTGFFPAGKIFGTVRYMAPEQAMGETISPATDVYALGLILYELLTGQTPFPGRTAQEQLLQRLSITPADARQMRPEIPAALAQVLKVMLAREPARRYADGNQLLAALRSLPLASVAEKDRGPSGVTHSFLDATALGASAIPETGTPGNFRLEKTELLEANVPAVATGVNRHALSWIQPGARAALVFLLGNRRWTVSVLLLALLLIFVLAASIHLPARQAAPSHTVQPTAPAVQPTNTPEFSLTPTPAPLPPTPPTGAPLPVAPLPQAPSSVAPPPQAPQLVAPPGKSGNHHKPGKKH